MQPKWNKLIESVHTFSQRLITLLCSVDGAGQMGQTSQSFVRSEAANGEPGGKGQDMPYRRKDCRKFFSVKTGTPMADNGLPGGSGKNWVYFPERRKRYIRSK